MTIEHQQCLFHRHSVLSRLLGISLLFALNLFHGYEAAALPYSISPLQGLVLGGAQPLSGSSIKLYATGREGIGSAGEALLTEPVYTDEDGHFSIKSFKPCPTPTSDLYIIALGGKAGSPGETENNSVALVAALGSCDTLSTPTFTKVDEVTTVAFMAAMSPYMSSLSRVGSISGDPLFSSAITGAKQLVNSGRLLSAMPFWPNSDENAPTQKLNALANILVACIESPGGVAGDGSPCGNLYSLATYPDEMAPSDTATAMLNIMKQPARNVGELFTLSQDSPSLFQPGLTSVPLDWSLALVPGLAFSGADTNDEQDTTRSKADQNSAVITAAAVAKSSNSVEELGTIPVTQPLHGLGFNINPANDWEFKMAAAAGATHARFQCAWTGTETQTAPPQNTNTTTQFALQPGCISGLQSAVSLGLHPTVVAAFGPPYHAILMVTIPAGAKAGARSIRVQFASGVGGDTLTSIRPIWDNIMAASGGYITKRHSYAGGLITSVTLIDSTHATLTLASALSVTLAASTSTKFVINEGLYLSAASSSPTDPSVLAYTKYAQFLATEISSSKGIGDVEIWNEPPWANDPWDARNMFYDGFTGVVSPGPQAASLPNFGFAAALQSQRAPSGVNFTWGGTNKSGANSLLMPRMYANTGKYAIQPATVFNSESFHPYGNSPEDQLWTSKCLTNTIRPYPTLPTSFSACNLAGTNGGNMSQAIQQALVEQSINPSYGIGHSITETGVASGTNAQKARFIMRQYLGYQAVGITPIDFYKFNDSSAYTFVNPVANLDGSYSPLPALTALSGLMADLATIGVAPVVPINSTVLPAVTTYSGTYPLSTVQIVGTRSGDVANSVLMAVWQRSNVSGVVWTTLAQPVAAPIALQIPAGMAPLAVLNLVTRSAVFYTLSGQRLSFTVSDDPIEVLLVPSTTPKLLTLAVQSASVLLGVATTVLSATVAYTGAVAPTGAIGFALDGGSAVDGTCVGSASPLTCSATVTTSSLSSGSHIITVAVAADTQYSQATSTGALTVVTPHLAFSVQPVTTTIGTSFTVTVQLFDASGNPVVTSSVVTLSLASNPGSATLSGSTKATTVNGIATFSGISINIAGNGYSLSASTPNTTSAVSTAFNVAAQKLLTITVPSTSISSGAASTVLTATVAYTGFPAPTGLVSFALDGGSAVQGICVGSSSPLTCTATINTSTVSTGSHTISVAVAADTQYSQTSSTGTLMVIYPHLAFSVQPVTTTAGTVFTVAVKFIDASGNLLATNSTVTLSMVSNPGNADLSGSLIVAAVNGVATFPGISLNAAGAGYTLSASTPNATSIVSTTFNITASALFIYVSNVVVGTTVYGGIYLPKPTPTDLTVYLSSSDTAHVTVVPSITIPAGLTSILFPYTGVGPGIAKITGTSSTYPSLTRTIAAVPAAPLFSVATGTYAAGQQVTLTDSAPGAVIYYTLDGSTPTIYSTAYTTALILSSTQTVKAVAIKDQSSTVSTATYTVAP